MRMWLRQKVQILLLEDSKLKQNKGKNDNDTRNTVNAGSAGVAGQKSDKRDDE